MEGWQDRLAIESAELFLKIFKLKEFAETDKFSSLDEETRGLLMAQLAAMSTYGAILALLVNKMTREEEDA